MAELFDDCKFQSNVPDGLNYAAGSQPIIFYDSGKVIRSFKEVSDGYIEQSLEKEVIEKVDLAKYIEHFGSPNPDRVYDILELGYWTKDGTYVEPDADFVAHMDSLSHGEDGFL